MTRKRNYPVTVWLSEKELILLKDKISKTYLNQSDYIRKCSLEKNIMVLPGVRELIIEFKRIGNNLDQISCSVRGSNIAAVENNIENIKYDLKIAWANLAKILKKINR
jgi:hypothetical protein